MDVKTNTRCAVACSFSLPCHGLAIEHGHFRLRLAVLTRENCCEVFSPWDYLLARVQASSNHLLVFNS